MTLLTDYTDLVTSEHRDKPKFLALVSLFGQFAVDFRTQALAMPGLFDVDVAVGDQLDALALWVGATRTVTITSNAVYPVGAPYVYSLTDAELRRFVRARILANFWDGTPEALLPILAAFFSAAPGQYGAEVDRLDMSVDIYVTGIPPTAAELAILLQWLVPIRPAGVKLNGVWVTDGGPLFGLDVENFFLAGPDVGHFGVFALGT